MSDEAQYVVVTTVVDSEEAAQRITGILLENRLAACVQAEAVQSSFWWQDEIQEAREIRLQAKAPAARTNEIIAAIHDNHPYEVPEIIVTPILSGHLPYLQWLDAETQPPAAPPPNA